MAERARNLIVDDGRALLGITGKPGVGKSTFAQALVDVLGEEAQPVGMDGFHLSDTQLDALGLSDRKGAIETFDGGGFVALVRRLRLATDETIYAPEFSHAREESIAGAVAIDPGVRLVVIEGNYLLAGDFPWRELKSLLNEVWYVECDEDVRIAQLIARHEAAGRSSEEARAWALGSDQQNADLVATTRPFADLVIGLGQVQAPTDRLSFGKDGQRW